MQLPDSIEAAGKALRARAITCVQLAQTALARVAALQPAINAFLTVTADLALARAAALDRELASGRDRGPLHGIPYACKDCIDTAGVRTTVGSRCFEDRVPAADAIVVERLAAAGAVLLGKTNLNELGAGTSGRNMRFGDVHNPWSHAHSPGGSSSGSAAAVAAGAALGALGTDTGGSIRVPAACTGIVGLRPTLGRVPTVGVYERARSFDVVAPLARNVRDCALMLKAMAPEEDYAREIDSGIAGLRVGMLEDFCDVGAHLRSLGAQVREISLPEAFDAHAFGALMDIMLYEFHRVMGGQFRRCPDPDAIFGPVVCANLRRGAQIGEDDYRRALAARERQSAAIRSVFGEIDALVTPVLPAPTPRLDADPAEFDRQRRFMLPFSGAGVPAISIPCGTSAGLPLGVQILADRAREGLILRVARAYESTTEWHTMRWQSKHGGGAAS